MDFLNRAFAQLSDLFRSMTPGARITAGLLLAVVVVSLGYLFTYRVSGSGEHLFGGEPFGYQHLSRIEVALGAAGVDYTVDNGRIRVPRGQQSKAMGALADADALPPQWNQALEKAIKGESVFLNPDQREARYRNAWQQDLSSVISNMPDVNRASVLIDSKPQPGFRKTTINTASVSVEPDPGRAVSDQQATAIRNMVASAISGMKPENVTVTDTVNSRSFYGSLESGDGTMGDKNGVLKRGFESDWRERILRALAYVPGVTVETNVTLSDVQKLVTRTLTPDKKGTPLQTTEKTREHTQEGPSTAGRPGFVANQPGAVAPASTKGTSESDTESETKEHNLVGGSSEEKEQVPMTPKRVTAVVGVPTSYFEKLWRERNPSAEGEEPKKPTPADLTTVQTQVVTDITKTVAGLLPEVEGVADKTELVTVTPFEDLAPAPIAEPPMSESLLAWLGQYWSTLGMLGLVGFSLLMLRSMIRSAPGEVRAGAARVAAESGKTAAVEEEAEEKPREPRLARFAKSGASLRDELSELVHEDTEAAANILRSWIGSPASKS